MSNAQYVVAIAKFLAEARKAYAAGAAAASAILGPKLLAGQAPNKTDYELALGAAIFAAVLVFFVKNQPPAAPVAPSPPAA